MQGWLSWREHPRILHLLTLTLSVLLPGAGTPVVRMNPSDLITCLCLCEWLLETVSLIWLNGTIITNAVSDFCSLLNQILPRRHRFWWYLQSASHLLIHHCLEVEKEGETEIELCVVHISFIGQVLGKF